MLKINNLTCGYGQSMIIHNLDLEVRPGEVIALMGRNGVGKTTLLKTIMGLLKPKEGDITFRDKNITRSSSEDRALGGIAYVPQGRDIFPFLRVRENLVLGLEARGKKEIPGDIYSLFPELEALAERKGGDLSGGQQQQLAIARMMITSPQLVLLDEPTEGIQPSIVTAIEQAIRTIKARGEQGIILVEQFVEFALRLADTCYVMEKGSIVFREETDKLDSQAIREHISL